MFQDISQDFFVYSKLVDSFLVIFEALTELLTELLDFDGFIQVRKNILADGQNQHQNRNGSQQKFYVDFDHVVGFVEDFEEVLDIL